jgi:hypothetical protein
VSHPLDLSYRANLQPPPPTNPWLVTLWLFAISFIIAGWIMVAAGLSDSSGVPIVLLVTFGTAFISAGFLSLVLAVVVSALRWRPSPTASPFVAAPFVEMHE